MLVAQCQKSFPEAGVLERDRVLHTVDRIIEQQNGNCFPNEFSIELNKKVLTKP